MKPLNFGPQPRYSDRLPGTANPSLDDYALSGYRDGKPPRTRVPAYKRVWIDPMVQAQQDTLDRVRAEVRAARQADRIARENRIADARESNNRAIARLAELNRAD